MVNIHQIMPWTTPVHQAHCRSFVRNYHRHHRGGTHHRLSTHRIHSASLMTLPVRFLWVCRIELRTDSDPFKWSINKINEDRRTTRWGPFVGLAQNLIWTMLMATTRSAEAWCCVIRTGRCRHTSSFYVFFFCLLFHASQCCRHFISFRALETSGQW